MAECRCGWAECAESPHDARVLARHHRQFSGARNSFHPAHATRIGGRLHQADAIGVHVSITGQHQVWAVADGIGDQPQSAHAAGSAATIASYVAADRGAVAGLLAATHALSQLPRADTVLVVAAPLPPEQGSGWDIAWVGDCRAYEVRPDLDVCAQLTLDHTHGQQLRTALADRYRDRRHDLEALARASDHIVTTSVASATPETVGRTRIHGPRRRLILTSDGLHKHMPARALARATRG
ncbi:PP2C family protein-serine/threonine phosphatase [Amycolatopsis sp. CA-230715]|uniref:PP2C family protein-serine/threonine phosphatase n=1 Tax=Amycolatopsis sp. CA-230715 TaxID=2745196 RepID=UPI001C02D25A|nr:serine/threonine protein phosphatase [Amycolatopsis sp. CA-230715]